MSKQKSLVILSASLLSSASLGGYAYATSCILPPSEVLDMQLERVTYDGVVQIEPPEYSGLSGRLNAGGFVGAFEMTIARRTANSTSLVDFEMFYAE